MSENKVNLKHNSINFESLWNTLFIELHGKTHNDVITNKYVKFPNFKVSTKVCLLYKTAVYEMSKYLILNQCSSDSFAKFLNLSFMTMKNW